MSHMALYTGPEITDMWTMSTINKDPIARNPGPRGSDDIYGVGQREAAMADITRRAKQSISATEHVFDTPFGRQKRVGVDRPIGTTNPSFERPLMTLPHQTNRMFTNMDRYNSAHARLNPGGASYAPMTPDVEHVITEPNNVGVSMPKFSRTEVHPDRAPAQIQAGLSGARKPVVTGSMNQFPSWTGYMAPDGNMGGVGGDGINDPVSPSQMAQGPNPNRTIRLIPHRLPISAAMRRKNEVSDATFQRPVFGHESSFVRSGPVAGVATDTGHDQNLTDSQGLGKYGMNHALEPSQALDANHQTVFRNVPKTSLGARDLGKYGMLPEAGPEHALDVNHQTVHRNMPMTSLDARDLGKYGIQADPEPEVRNPAILTKKPYRFVLKYDDPNMQGRGESFMPAHAVPSLAPESRRMIDTTGAPMPTTSNVAGPVHGTTLPSRKTSHLMFNAPMQPSVGDMKAQAMIPQAPRGKRIITRQGMGNANAEVNNSGRPRFFDLSASAK